MDVTSLRSINDFVRPTIDAFVRTPVTAFGALSPLTIGAGWTTSGLTHTPWNTMGIFGQPVVGGVTLADRVGLTHSPYAYQQALGGYPQAGYPGAYSPVHAYGGIDPFGIQRNGLSHSPFGVPVSPLALELARQQYLTQAIAARQSVLEAMCRSWGIGV